MKNSENIYLKNLYKRVISIPSNPETWVRKGRYVYISAYHSTRFMAAQVNSVYRTPIFRLMKECTWPFSVGVGLPSNSPLKPRIDQIIIMIVESGLVDFWFQESVKIATQGQRKREDGESDKSDDGSILVPLNMEHMQGVFYILGLCIIFIFLVFLIELTFRGLRKRNL
ncbi:hypothetical protein Pmani_015792 [Petrolisthes manimaculis]|uniref:Uncharacterized protein n=1 Tax=Petrolisthes manimaculis TaxID=1843537 RepID=A0AAE1PQV2_9EUCA|nr:hypothetical protein Pmani_015792 [Petrolisthes manimaculis]